MHLIITSIHIGLDKPFQVLHLSDNHITLADERDNERKNKLAEERTNGFPSNFAYFGIAENYAKNHGLPIVHTGDLIDFVSEKNLDFAKRFIDENDVFICAGNHEFSQYVGEAVEDEAYRNQTLDKVQAVFKNNIRFDVKNIGGVNFVALDDGYGWIDQWQLERLKQVVKEGKPIILMIHTPIYENTIVEILGPLYKRTPNMIGDPDKKVDPVTKEAIDYIKTEPLFKAVLTGHHHHNIEGNLTDTLRQYQTGFGSARLITID